MFDTVFGCRFFLLTFANVADRLNPMGLGRRNTVKDGHSRDQYFESQHIDVVKRCSLLDAF